MEQHCNFLTVEIRNKATNHIFRNLTFTPKIKELSVPSSHEVHIPLQISYILFFKLTQEEAKALRS